MIETRDLMFIIGAIVINNCILGFIIWRNYRYIIKVIADLNVDAQTNRQYIYEHLDDKINALSDVHEDLETTVDDMVTTVDKLVDEIANLNAYKNMKKVLEINKSKHGVITRLPEKLPASLTMINCQCNNLTQLPEKLPTTLQSLHCSNNQLTQLPEKLPASLNAICCNHNKLTRLPEQLPASLMTLDCKNNQLTILPDLPTTLQTLDLSENSDQLYINYPLLKKRDSYYTVHNNYDKNIVSTIVNHINEQNSMMRTKARMAIINNKNVLLECYMKKHMHPANLKPLLDDKELEVDVFMESHVASL